LFCALWAAESQLLSRCLEDESGSSDHTGEAHTGLDVGGGTSEHGHLGGGRGVLGHGGGSGAVLTVAGSDGLSAGSRARGHGSGAVLSVADSDGLGVDVAGRVGEGKSLGVHVVASGASGLSSASSADLNNDGGTSGLGASVDSGGNRDHGTAGGRVDSGGGGSVRAAVASNRSGRDDSGSRADVDGLRNRDHLSDNGTTVLERAVGDGRSARSNGNDSSGVDSRGSETASRDGGGTVARAGAGTAVGDTLGELNTLLGVGSLDIAVESASTSDSVECSANTGVGSITEVHAVVEAGGNSTSGEGEVARDRDLHTEMVSARRLLVAG
jgi:hypothetical protein